MKKKLKICVISTTVIPCPPSGYAGLEMISWQCANGLKNLGHEVLLIAPNGSKTDTDLHETTLRERERYAYYGYKERLKNYDVIIDHSWEKWSYISKMTEGLNVPILGVLHAPVHTMYNEPPPVEKPCFITISNEISNILKKKTSKFKIYLRFFCKLNQIIFFNKKELNKGFHISIYKKIEDSKNQHQFILINNLNKLFHFKNFILVALNLAFLGSWVKFKNLHSNKIIFWPDGLFSKIFKSNIKKIPGREIIDNIKIKNNVKKIYVLGKQDKKNFNYLKKKFKNKVIKNINLPFDNWQNLYNFLPNHIKNNIKKMNY